MSRGSTNIPDEDGGDLIQSDVSDLSHSSPCKFASFLMHHKSSFHESLLQWGMATLTGSCWPTSVTTAPHPTSSLAMLCTNVHRDFMRRDPLLPPMDSPYKKYTPNWLNTSGNEGNLSHGSHESNNLLPMQHA